MSKCSIAYFRQIHKQLTFVLGKIIQARLHRKTDQACTLGKLLEKYFLLFIRSFVC